MDVRLGIFAVPNSGDRPSIVETVVAADRAGVEIVGIQDHPYQRRYHDTWTLMSYLAGRTERADGRLGLID